MILQHHQRSPKPSPLRCHIEPLAKIVAAAVVLRPQSQASVNELRQFAATKLADFKVPRQIVFVDELPKGATGKIARNGLAEKLADQLKWTSREAQNELETCGGGRFMSKFSASKRLAPPMISSISAETLYAPLK